ncbi:MAG: ABC transporter permease [Acidimicrobiales bacterium]
MIARAGGQGQVDTVRQAVAGEGGPGQPAPLRRSRGKVSQWAERLALPGAWVAVVIIFGGLEPSTFLTIGNFSNIFGSQAVLFVLTMAVIMPSINRDFDLSLGAVAALTAMIVAIVNAQDHVPIVYACLIGLGVAVAVGVVNGIAVVGFENDSFIVTLGTSTVLAGIIYFTSGSQTITGTSPGLSQWTYRINFLGIPVEFYYALGIMLVVWYVTSFTPLGQRSLFVGQSRDVARLSGIRVKRIRFGAFIAAGLVAGIAGIFSVGTTGSAAPDTGAALLLPAYAGAFLGLTSIQPGRFNALGAGVAIYFLATGVAGLQLLGAQNYVQQLFYGGALVIAVTISRLIRKR